MPHAPDPPTDDQALASWQREREVRVTVLRLIAAHLRDGAPASWQGHDLDFTGAVLVEADFRGARFTGGDILFVKALFAGDGTDQIIFDEANFAEDSHVYFRQRHRPLQPCHLQRRLGHLRPCPLHRWSRDLPGRCLHSGRSPFRGS
ncbi:pentapeptide repeat-containing protein [Streptomyces europaeiscabiei]|uniref:pentapeptide repeat-containing protein n=1 Tax=Streptomyces europaeiscabiei TaxID=146819 RepID=UPI0038F73A7D